MCVHHEVRVWVKGSLPLLPPCVPRLTPYQLGRPKPNIRSFQIPWSTSLGSLVIILPWDRVGRHFHCSQVWNVASHSSGCCIRSVLAHMQAVLHSLAVKFGWCSSRWDISRRWSRYLFSRMKDLYCVLGIHQPQCAAPGLCHSLSLSLEW